MHSYGCFLACLSFIQAVTYRRTTAQHTGVLTDFRTRVRNSGHKLNFRTNNF